MSVEMTSVDPEVSMYRDLTVVDKVSDVETTVSKLLEANPVIMFSKKACPFLL